MDVGARLDQLRREPERLRRRVRVLEAPGVGDERDVERLRDLRGQLDVELREEVAQDLARRGGVADDEVEIAEARVVVVVVDVDRQRRLLEQRRVRRHALLVGAVERDQHPLAGVLRRLAPEALERHEAVLARKRRVAVEVHLAVLAERVERELHREQRAEGVAVRVFVRDEEEAVVRTESVRYRSQVIRRLLGRAHRSVSSCGPHARPSDRIRRPAAGFASFAARARAAPAGRRGRPRGR